MGHKPQVPPHRRASAMRATLQTKLLAGFAAVLAIMVLVSAFSYRTKQQRDQTVADLVETMQAIDRTNTLLVSWIDAQTELHEYLLTGREESLESYKAGASGFRAALADLKRLD